MEAQRAAIPAGRCQAALPSPRPPDDEEEAVREEPQPPVIETYICVQIRANARMMTIPGRLPRAGSPSMAGHVTVTDANGQERWQPRHAGGRGCPCGGEAVIAREEDP